MGIGSGTEPFYQTGSVYFTGPYDGAPFGLSVVVPAVAGPFNLGNVVVRAALRVNPVSTQVTAETPGVGQPGGLPQIIDGVPLRIRTINVTLNDPSFTLNPTNCSRMSITGTVTSTTGTATNVSAPFEANGCRDLPFKPALTASTQAKASREGGASLTVKVASGPGQANIAKVQLRLPKALPARLATLKKACTEEQFNANPAGCPAASVWEGEGAQEEQCLPQEEGQGAAGLRGQGPAQEEVEGVACDAGHGGPAPTALFGGPPRADDHKPKAVAIIEPVATVAQPRIEHPRIQPWEYSGLQAEAGWCLPVELIGGEAVVMSPVGDAASAVQGELFLALGEWQRRVGDQGVLRQDVFVVFAPDEHLAPDICWWSAGRRPPVVRGEVDVVPDLVVEVLSPSTRANDLGPKRAVYMRAGVRELWLADPDSRTLTRVPADPRRPADAGEVVTLGVADVLRSELLDGFELELARVFAAGSAGR